MERLEEGLNEEPGQVQKNLRVSAYIKDDQNQESFLIDSQDLATSTKDTSNQIEEMKVAYSRRVSERLDDYDHIDDSFFQHARA